MSGNGESVHIILELTSDKEGNTGIVRYDTERQSSSNASPQQQLMNLQPRLKDYREGLTVSPRVL